MARIALALSIAALGVALLGSTPLGAAAQELVIPRGAVGTAELENSAVTGAKVKDRSLGVHDFARGQIPRGPAGPAGPPGTIEGVAATGDLSGTYPGPTLAASAVATMEIEDGALRLADTAVLSGQVRVDLPAIQAHACVSSSAPVQGLKPYDRTLVLPTQNLPVGAFVTQVFNTGAPNRVLFRVCNATTKSLDPPLGGWAYVAWRQ